MMQLEISRDAAEDLRELHGYGAQKYGLRHTDAYLRELFEAFDHVVRWPHGDRERRAKTSSVRLHRRRAHNILYSIQNDTVIILRVFHHSVNWIDLL